MTLAKRAMSAAAMLIALGLLPATVHAQHRIHGGGRHGGGHFDGGHHRFHHRPFGSRVVVFAPFVPFGFGYYGAPWLVYSDPPAYSPPPRIGYPTSIAYGSPYAPPPAYAAPPPAAYAPPPPSAPPQQDAEPLQREVVFPSGRYVLRGDGINAPYTWVWIPNPPTLRPLARRRRVVASTRSIRGPTPRA